MARPPEWLLCAVILTGAAFAAGPEVAIAPTPQATMAGAELVVNCANDSPTAADDVTLRTAVERAANDPRANVIRFDPAVFGAKKTIIRINKPLVFAPSPQGDAAQDVLDGARSDVALHAEHDAAAALIVRGGRLAIRSLTMSGGKVQTIQVAGDARVSVVDCRITGSTGSGATVIGRGQLNVSGGRIGEHKSHGIESRDTASLIVTGATVELNRQAGVALLDRVEAFVERSQIVANVKWGIVATNDAVARVADTSIEAAGFANVDATGRSRLTFEGCQISRGDRFGVLASGNASLSFHGCSLTANAWRGLELQSEASAELTESSVERTGGFGAVLFGHSTLQVEGGSISRNSGHGLTIRDRAAADIRDCSFEENEYSGVGAPDACDGGRLSVRRCIFRANGMRPVFRGPLHIDPPVPTVARIAGDCVTVRAAPRAVVDLYLDRAGEAARYVRTVVANDAGEFTVPTGSLLSGEVITAAATTTHGHTSEFNVVAGRLDAAILAALLARTGPLSDSGGEVQPAASIQRWPRGSHVVFQFQQRPAPQVEHYVRWFAASLKDWTGDGVTVEVRVASGAVSGSDLAVVPVQYASAEDSRLNGTGGTTFTQWDSLGYFEGPIRIVLAQPAPGEDACPRVAIHEMCHALGLYHARVGLLSRMQGIPAPASGMLNDFAPAPTFFDVAALRILYTNALRRPTTLAQLAEAGFLRLDLPRRVAARESDASDNRAPLTATDGVLSAPPATRR